jgi:ion channel
MTGASVRAALRRHPSGTLLAVQLLGLFLYPLMHDTGAGRALFNTFGVLVLALVLWVVMRSPTANWIAWLLAAPAVVLSVLGGWGGAPQWLVWSQLLESALYFYAAAGLIAYMLADHEVTADELVAAGATFTLLAWAFAFAYSACQSLAPGSFIAAVDPGAARTWMELLFLSFTTLSGVGLGDVVPISPWARALVMLEEFVGVMYIALVVSRLIGLTIVRSERR